MADSAENTHGHGSDNGYSWHEIWMVGVGLASLSLIFSSVGLTLQRMVHLKEQRNEVVTPVVVSRACPHEPLFAVGMTLYAAASIPDVISYGLLPQAIVSNMSCCRLVLISILGHYCLGEHVNFMAIVGIVLCISGTVLCLNFGPGPQMHLDPDPYSFFTPGVVAYIACGFIVLIAVLMVVHSDSLGCGSHQQLQHVALPLATSLAYALEKVFNTAIGFAPHNFWAAPQWLAPYAAIIALGLLDFYLNTQGVRRLPVQVFVPAVFAGCISLCYFQSTIIFRELRDLSMFDFVVSLLGMFLSLVGAVLIQPPNLRSCCSPQASPSALLAAEADTGVSVEEAGSRSGVEGVEGKCGDGDGSAISEATTAAPAFHR